MTMVALVTCLAAMPVPAAAKPSPPPIRVATYNVCKTTCGVGQFSWQNRQAAVIRNILSADPDVLALQEVDNSADWIASRLARHGYALVQACATTASTVSRAPRTPACTSRRAAWNLS